MPSQKNLAMPDPGIQGQAPGSNPTPRISTQSPDSNPPESLAIKSSIQAASPFPDYANLLNELLALMAEGQTRAQTSVNQIRLETYHAMGRKMVEAQDLMALHGPANPRRGNASAPSTNFVTRLATDLTLDKALVYRIMQFYRFWPDAIPIVEGKALTWTHFVELLTVADDKARKFYLASATREGWDRSTLRLAIKKDFFQHHDAPITAEASHLARDPNPLYVYKAVVESVVDGDTLLARIDLGFNVWISQRIRFRGINTAEIAKQNKKTTSDSRALRAKAFTESKLQEIPFVVIKTYKTDMYGRYVADVFYSPTLTDKRDVATKGFFLNDEIAQAGLADLTP